MSPNLPWRVDDYAMSSQHMATRFKQILDAESNLVADLGDSDQDQAANAAFIVRAVNAHDDLLAALEHLTEAIGDEGDFEYVTGDRGIYPAVRAALAKARGEASV